MPYYRSLGRLDGFLADTAIPGGMFPEPALRQLFGGVHVLDYEARTGNGTLDATAWLGIEGELSVPLAGQDGARLTVGEVRDGLTFLRAEVRFTDELELILHDIPICVQLDAGQLGLDGGAGEAPGFSFRGTLRVSSALELTATDVRLRAFLPGLFEHGSELDIAGFHLGRECLALTWEQLDRQTFARQAITFRLVFGQPLREVRVDVELGGMGRALPLPGLNLQLPDDTQLSVVVNAKAEGDDRSLSQAGLYLTFAEGSGLTVTSDFAWERDEGREVHADQGRASPDPLLQLSIAAKQRVTLALAEFEWKEARLPHFLRQLTTALEPLNYGDPDTLCLPTATDSFSMRAEDWSFGFKLNLEKAPFTLPFLKQEPGGEDAPQFLQVKPNLSAITLDIPNHSIAVPVTVKVSFGPLNLETTAELAFNWETFSFAVRHSDGLKLYANEAELAPKDENGKPVEYLGLTWGFKGTPITENGKTRYHLFTLATDKYNYQLQQAPGASFEVKYLHVSDEPIVFAITDFALTPKGLNVTATVTDRPAKLNGLDTRFRFNDSRLVIVENRVQDFTLNGSGPMPPALVGDAMADISLQLAQRDGALTLVSGGARLRGSKLLHCQSTRFEFQVDAIGLRFVNDGRFHLYFVLTGSAQFRLAESDDAEGALALLPKLRIDLVECPLTGDARVISKHVRFLIELPKPLSFSFLGCFELELRGIGFIPQADVFGGDGAMLLTGQLKFAQGAGDTPDTRVDYHRLYIGLPEEGHFLPRLHFGNLPVNLNFGAAFRLNGVVDFVDSTTEKGFSGEGTLQIQGLPTFAAAFSFLRVRRDESSPWLRAWFIYLEARQISLMIPVVQLYVREVGLGFGYRYTLASIKAADQANDVRELLKELKKLSRTQGDLSKRDRWALDLEDPGQDPRWTIVLRAMISQTSASASPLQWDENAEKLISCLFLLDAVIAFRSDLTFFMAVRGWLNANYYDYVSNYKGLRERPFVSGFVLLSPRQKRLLAHVASNPNGQLGPHPQLPEFVEKALTSCQFSATLLVEPGLLHYELGWPNMLRWSQKLGPLEAELRGGFIWRLSREELVTGTSFLARAKLDFSAQVNLGIVGVRVSAQASLAYGARYIGLLSLKDPVGSSALYGGIGIEAHIRFAIEFWIKLKLGFIKIKKSFRFSFGIDFTAGLEVGMVGLSPNGIGLRGTGTLSLSVMGRSFHLSAHIGMREGKVAEALERTKHVLDYGLEATDVEGIPGVEGAALRSGRPAPAALRADTLRTEEAPPALQRRTLAEGTFEAPGYTVFAIRSEDPKGTHYFVLMPQGERPTPSGEVEEEPGFLPVPPAEGAWAQPGYNDFVLTVPRAAKDTYTLEQLDPLTGMWKPHAPTPGQPSQDVAWRAHWETELEKKGERYSETGVPEVGDETFTLARYLRHAFVTEVDALGATIRLRDPARLPPTRSEDVVADDRVHNPTDNAFEAAVRGAVEQFRGSPFFKRDDTRVEYDRLLGQAYQDRTTVYSDDGKVPDDAPGLRKMLEEQQAHQLRGMVVHDIVADLRALAASPDGSGLTPEQRERSVALHMGLVFRVSGGLPAWLDGVPERGEPEPRLRQRIRVEDTTCSGSEVSVRTFNVRDTNFTRNPPQFRRVQQLTDARTIALAWELVWEQPPRAGLTPAQASPEHHLVHYHVRRRGLESNTPEAVYTLKGAQTLHREGGALKRLQPRFQLVDHFHEDTAEDLAALPLSGRSYLYTITPYDFAGNAGRPLTVVATRYPSEPPLVPVNAECVVRYKVDLAILARRDVGTPRVVTPDRVFLEWSEPSAAPGQPQVPVKTYVLVFRRETSLPIGSYGLDSATQRAGARSLPTSNARPLPTDVRVTVVPTGPREKRVAEVPLTKLRELRVLPAENDAWRPEAWRLFMQTESGNGVPSALAPVQLLLRVVRADAPADDTDNRRREERRPAELEWLPSPVVLPVLPPEDVRATVEDAHFPMPVGTVGHPEAFRFNGQLTGVLHQKHPAGVRCIRFRWNQGPSGAPDHPLDLHAGYHLLELDTDAHTTETFGDADRLSRALRGLQEVQMLPAGDMQLVPGDTLATSAWEAWYPSTLQRRRTPAARAAGSQLSLTPGPSWRESLLEWPHWPGLTDSPAPSRTSALHPVLAGIVQRLQRPAGDSQLPAFTVDLQISPPTQPGSFADLLRATAAQADPYGWGVLQRLGLSMAFSLREPRTGEVLKGQALLDAVRDVLAQQGVLPDEAARHLHVELLFQPGRAVALREGAVVAEDLLALVQLSLRPVVRQRALYSAIHLEGPAGAPLDVVLHLKPATTCSVVEQTNPAAGQAELEPEPGATTGTVSKRTFVLPLNGKTQVLLRTRSAAEALSLADLPGAGVALGRPLSPEAQALLTQEPLPAYVTYRETPAAELVLAQSPHTLSADARALLRTTLAQEPAALTALLGMRLEPLFQVTDERTTYFPADVEPLAALLAHDEDTSDEKLRPEAVQWRRFRRYAESLSSTDPGMPAEQKIRIPASGSALEDVLPDVLTWSQRFFDATGRIDFTQDGPLVAPEGPWVATAYPRASSPAYSSPDESGRLTYDHLLEDAWAHNYRFYVRPFARYDLLWQGLRQSPLLYPDAPAVEPARPDPLAGGLDVVMDRTRAVDMPLVLSSTRLDADAPLEPSAPDEPLPPVVPSEPGSTWEVVVAQHPEQALMERNQTLARQLGFRQVAFTLLRGFAFPGWVSALEGAAGLSGPLVLTPVEDRVPEIPGTLPEQPEHLDLSGRLSVEDARGLDLPLRVGAFQQGAQVIQWEGLPFYYKHRLLLMAQTHSTVSPLNEVRQRDFEYRAPEKPVAWVEGMTRTGWVPTPPFGGTTPASGLTVRARGLGIPLRRLWESLPERAQQRWGSERPRPGGRGPSWLPDLDVVYQVVEEHQGNVEVQAELYFDAAAGAFAKRQLGGHFLADIAALSLPEVPLGTEEDRFLLAVTVQQVTELELSRPYTAPQQASIPEPTRSKLAFNARRLSFVGVLTHEDRQNLAVLDALDRQAVGRVHDGWYARVPVASAMDVPASLADVVDFEKPEDLPLVWTGPLDAAQAQALRALPGDEELRRTVETLIATAAGAGADTVTTVVAPRGPEQLPPALAQKVELRTDAAGTAYTTLVWKGHLWAEHQLEIDRWVRVTALADAFARLKEAFDAAVATRPLPAARPLAGELPAVLRGRLGITDAKLRWKGPAPTDAEREALAALAGDAAFLGARTRLLAAIDTDRTVPHLGERPAEDTLPEFVRAQLRFATGTVTWTAPAPTDAQRAALLAMPGDAQWQGTVRLLLQLVDVDQEVDLAPVKRRPRQGDLPDALSARLTVEPTAVHWRGPLDDITQREQLLALDGDAPFVAALQALVADLDARVLQVPFTAPLRPTLDAAHPLSARLVIGGAVLRYHGLMTRDEALRLRALFPRGAEKAAVERLHKQSHSRGMDDRKLGIRARRGSARPSPIHPLDSRPL
ncbi:hypothetical protein [Pyxidicoccus caerfyrddinensis]|uniref:hypothetical protein n=1 Tax=Pyxidicoccus caerfyrddinensis TaxID=2709663 RepID=UPI0013DA1514|nr:hypothetical protein [Pyxidicoccus caerfyrddinensis]